MSIQNSAFSLRQIMLEIFLLIIRFCQKRMKKIMGLRDYIKANRQRAMLVLFLITLTQLTTTMYTYLTSPQLNAIASGKFELSV